MGFLRVCSDSDAALLFKQQRTSASRTCWCNKTLTTLLVEGR